MLSFRTKKNIFVHTHNAFCLSYSVDPIQPSILCINTIRNIIIIICQPNVFVIVSQNFSRFNDNENASQLCSMCLERVSNTNHAVYLFVTRISYGIRRRTTYLRPHFDHTICIDFLLKCAKTNIRTNTICVKSHKRNEMVILSKAIKRDFFCPKHFGDDNNCFELCLLPSGLTVSGRHFPLLHRFR